ncbi:fam-a protein [Plasmodium vinckei lentum]|uniref:Fam-a protein n=1 Tax=Plasmodium vinckei lentum TaxID=138297 RepID=A0A6V7SSP9_PLAVN|nr:fam-a protein [Plasmodium vinckei lentum]
MNKFYIQIVLFLLSVSVYLSNKTLAAELNPGNATSLRSIPDKDTSDEVYNKHKRLLCKNHKETAQAIEFMNEAVTKLEYYAELAKNKKSGRINSSISMDSCKEKHEDHTNNNESGRRDSNTSANSCEKKEEEEDPINKYVLKFNFQIDDPNKYNRIINKLWNPDYSNSSNHPNPSNHPRSSNHPNSSDPHETITKIVRVYNPNLVMIQRRFTDWIWKRQKYFYALVKKVQISENKTIIVMSSAKINDNSKDNTDYKNPIIESANLFETEIDSEDDIRNGTISKTYVNISGHLIEKKKTCVDVTYVMSINGLFNLIINEPSKDP